MSDEELLRLALQRAAAAAPSMSLDVPRQLALGARRRRARRWGAGVAAVAGLAVLGTGASALATGGAPWGPPVAGPPAASATSPSSSGAPKATAAPTPAGTPAPLTDEELLAAFDVPQSDEEILARTRAYQEAIAVCMRAAGFEYVPDVPDHLDDPVDPEWDEQWYATWGFGISIDSSVAYPAMTPRPDPNAGYVASLSDDERQAYRDALEGAGGSGLGCYVESYDDVAQDAGTPLPELVAKLESEAMVRYYDRLASDERMTDAMATLAQCAAEAGAVGYDPKDVQGVTIGVGGVTITPPYGLWNAYDQVSEAWDELNAAGPPSADALAQFQDWERAIAAAQYRCDAPAQAVAGEIQAEVTRDVVGPYRADLEALLATRPTG